VGLWESAAAAGGRFAIVWTAQCVHREGPHGATLILGMVDEYEVLIIENPRRDRACSDLAD
jgi:hypothetical protein